MEQTNGYTLAVPKADKRHMNVDEVRQYLGVSRHTIYRLVKERQIPFTPYGRIKRFDRERIDAWVKDRTVEAKI